MDVLQLFVSGLANGCVYGLIALRDTVGNLMGMGTVVIPGLESAVFGVILILFILFEPAGIYGR